MLSALCLHQRLRPLSYSQAHVILIAFSIDTPDSLENVTVKWIEEVRQICGPHIPVLLVGCKRDLRDDAIAKGKPLEGHFVQREQGKEVAQQIGARSYHECSALKSDGVDVSFSPFPLTARTQPQSLTVSFRSQRNLMTARTSSKRPHERPCLFDRPTLVVDRQTTRRAQLRNQLADQTVVPTLAVVNASYCK